MNRVKGVPVREPCEAVGIEDRCLAQCRSGRVAVDLELQPDAPRSLHLGSEPQEPILFEGLDPPEVERVSHRQLNGIPTPAAKTDAADELVQEAAQPPEPVSVVPAGLAADSLDRRARLLRRPSDSDRARDSLLVFYLGSLDAISEACERIGAQPVELGKPVLEGTRRHARRPRRVPRRARSRLVGGGLMPPNRM